MKYLIIKCEELGDQWECDCDRKPLTMCDNWEKWYQENQKNINYSFEVYEYIKNMILLWKKVWHYVLGK